MCKYRMDWQDPNDDSRPIISPRALIESYARKHGLGSEFRVNERFLMLLTGGEDIADLKSAFEVTEEAFPLPCFLGKRPLLVIDGQPPVSLLQKTLSAPVAVDALEVAIAMGARDIFLFGLCGAFAEDVNIGDIIIPTEIKREEGCSYHYSPTGQNAKPNAERTQALCAFLKGHDGIRLHTGTTVSTDAVFRQTLNKEISWRNKGILGVDMEMSALLTVAGFYGLPAVCMLVVSDKHTLEPETQWHWGGEELNRNRSRAVELLVTFIRSH